MDGSFPAPLTLDERDAGRLPFIGGQPSAPTTIRSLSAGQRRSAGGLTFRWIGPLHDRDGTLSRRQVIRSQLPQSLPVEAQLLSVLLSHSLILLSADEYTSERKILGRLE